MPLDDEWDWALLYYVGTVVLLRTEGHFWKLTPRKLVSLIKTHVDMNKPDDGGPKQGFIDNVF